MDSDSGENNATKCIKIWGKNAYKIIGGKEVLITYKRSRYNLPFKIF